MTILEVAQLQVTAGQETEFRRRIEEEGARILVDDHRTGQVQLLQGIESPDSFIFVIEWDSVEAHMEFRETEQFAKFRAILADHLTGSSFSHYEVATTKL